MVVTIILAVAAVAVLAAIVVVATGGGGELSVEHPDHPPLALPGRRAAGGTDAALLRLPMGLWGYHKQITDQALERFAHELTERDTRIAVLEQELAEARRRAGEDDRPETAGWRPAVPAAAPPPDAAPDTLVDMPVDPSAADPSAAAPAEAGLRDQPPAAPAQPAPPAIIQDRVVFDPRQAARDEAPVAEPGERTYDDDAARLPERHAGGEAGQTGQWTMPDGRGAYGDAAWDDPGAGRTETGGHDDPAPWAQPAGHSDLAAWAAGGEHAAGTARRTPSGAHDTDDATGRAGAGEPPADAAWWRAEPHDADDAPPWERPGERGADDAGRRDRPGGQPRGEPEDGR